MGLTDSIAETRIKPSRQQTSLLLIKGKQPQYCTSTLKPYKILFYNPDFGVMGGVERYILQTCKALQTRKQFKPVVACTQGGEFMQALQAENIPVYGIQTAACFGNPNLRVFDLSSMMQLQQIIHETRPDIIHVHCGQAENLFFKLLGYPLVYTFHGYSTLYSLSADRHPFKTWLKQQMQPLFQWQLPYLDKLLFVSNAEKQRLLAEGYLTCTTQGEILHNALPIEALQQQAAATDIQEIKSQLGLSKTTRCISFINRLDSNKNPLEFIEFAEILSQESDLGDLAFLVIGEGPQKEVVAQRIAQSPIAEKFLSLGYRKDIPNLLAISDLACFLPSMEGFGLGVLEAMAIGTPCLAYASGGIPELLASPETTHLLIPAHDIPALTAAAKSILRLPEADKQALSQALQKQACRFDFDPFIRQLETHYQEVLSANGK